ncbi:aminotransferase class I/II-fold pyridoxal phosphate-dependent enzyme [Lacisediminihabitans changchengi]|uniref:Aminotransferase class I/II-fold pyridoxal phosphate-dependent enzyme n=1 Tax=Lacisediminihabitans changchengi TaxID=2787634 RepID=A0A934SQY8_9MICO|nr:aminotransferase class I/II-fold pyridoxal phosphate-dependent enzyme [Lacisediminihabitans changchengi]MBK4347375.1 aminotransferase class I/II-fold pyridoxal phosphate-dependent enzyme [Lacisediminihabitans changchengi]
MRVSGSWQRAARGAMLLGSDGALSPTIFAEMSALAVKTGAINLGQGFPDEDGPVEVLDAAKRAIDAGLNQYPPGIGMPVLREAIASHQARFYGLTPDPDTEVLVTVGATEALAATILALTDQGDEVVTFEPFYDSYAAMIALSGAEHRTVALRAPDFQPDLDELRRSVTDRTRLILINNPHNPTGTVLSRETLALIVELAHRHDAIIVSDEVYEHLTFGVSHTPIASLPGALDRTVTISSGGKTFNTTGWKIGWLTAPQQILQAILAVKQFLTFVGGAPFQPAIAAGLELPDSYFRGIALDLAHKRDVLSAGLRAAGFTVSEPRGSYFVVADAAALGFSDAAAFCRQLPDLAGVVAVPISAFVSDENKGEYASLVRFAFCKRVEVLERASAQLASL